MPRHQTAGEAALTHGKNGVVRLLIHPGAESAGNQVLAVLQHTAGEVVPAAEQAQLSRDGPRLLLEQQFSRPGSQLTLENNGVADFFHSITSCYNLIIN